jgi:hypothetical protein
MRRLAAVMIASLIASLVSLAGCGEDNRLYVTIESDELTVPDQIDGLALEIIASRSHDTSLDAEVCRPVERRLPAEGEELAFPVVLGVNPGDGESSWACVGLRLTGTLHGAEVIRSEHLYCPDFAGVTDETIRLDAACYRDLTTSSCAEDQLCQPLGGDGSECVFSPVGSLFEVEASAEPWCERSR